MSKTFDTFQRVTIKNAAKAVAHFMSKRDAKLEKMAALQAEIDGYNNDIAIYEEAVKEITGGYTPLELCEKVARPSGGQNDWVFKYPDTIVPPVNANANANTASTTQQQVDENPESSLASDVEVREALDTTSVEQAEIQDNNEDNWGQNTAITEENNDPEPTAVQDPMDGIF